MRTKIFIIWIPWLKKSMQPCLNLVSYPAGPPHPKFTHTHMQTPPSSAPSPAGPRLILIGLPRWRDSYNETNEISKEPKKGYYYSSRLHPLPCASDHRQWPTWEEREEGAEICRQALGGWSAKGKSMRGNKKTRGKIRLIGGLWVVHCVWRNQISHLFVHLIGKHKRSLTRERTDLTQIFVFTDLLINTVSWNKEMWIQTEKPQVCMPMLKEMFLADQEGK